VRRGPSPQPSTTPRVCQPECVSWLIPPAILSSPVTLTMNPSAVPSAPVVLFLHGGCGMGGDDLEMPQPYRDAGFFPAATVTGFLR